MIDDLDKSLNRLLVTELSHLESEVSVNFKPPNSPPSSSPAIGLFLYDIRENRELRSNEWRLHRRGDGVAIKTPAPVRVACSYLVTAWAGADTELAMESEHRLLGEVMKVLLRHTTIPPGALQGSLKDQEPPLPATALQPGHLQSIGEFWQALGGTPKAALNYSVTIGIDVDQPSELGPVITDKKLKFRQVAEQE